MSAVVAAAKACLKTPFKHQGRVPGVGMDCAGLLVHCFKSLGLDHFDELGYPRNPYDGQLEKILDDQPSLRRIDLDQVQAGDVLAMRMRTAPQHIAIHIGFVSGHPYIVHASELHGCVVEHRLDDLWGARVMRAYRVEVQQ
jgi:cell wall-associated NlpC family hydrolase